MTQERQLEDAIRRAIVCSTLPPLAVACVLTTLQVEYGMLAADEEAEQADREEG